MFRTRVRLDTLRDIQNFVNTVSQIDADVKLEDDDGHCVNAKSMLGVMYSMEFKRIWCVCPVNILAKLLPFMIDNSDIG